MRPWMTMVGYLAYAAAVAITGGLGIEIDLFDIGWTWG
jgi:hypothetical protein